MTHPDPDLVRIARIGRPHGIHGDVTVQVFTDDPESRFVPGAVLTARTGSGRAVGKAGATGREGTLTVRRVRWNKDILLLGFQEVADRNGAESWRGTELFAAPEAEAEDDTWYEEDLVDLAVIVDGRRVGTVTGLVTGAVQDLLEVRLEDGTAAGHTALVPFVEEIVPEIDAEAGTLTLTPPPGLLSINAAGAEAGTETGSETGGGEPA